MKDDDIVEGRRGFEEIESVEERVCIGYEVVALRIGFGSCWRRRENEWCHYIA